MFKKENKKIILLNIAFLVLILFIAELSCSFISYKMHLKQVKPDILKTFTLKTYINDYKTHILDKYYLIFNKFQNVHPKFAKYFDTNKFRDIAYAQNPNDKNVLLFGCSYTYGSHLENNQAFHSKLAKYWNKNVYNYGIEAGSPREILYLLKNWKFIDQKPNNNQIEYVIYTYIDDHIRRLFINLRPNVPEFRVKNNELNLQNQYLNYYKMNYTYHYANNFIFNKYLYKNGNEIFTLYMQAIRDEIKNIFSNREKETKFIIFIYRDGISGFDEIKDLNIDDVTIIDLKDILNIDTTKAQYRSHDDHPNEKAWEIITPILIKEIEKRTKDNNNL